MLVKLDIYRKFTNALAVAVIVSVGWICYEVIFPEYILCILWLFDMFSSPDDIVAKQRT